MNKGNLYGTMLLRSPLLLIFQTYLTCLTKLKMYTYITTLIPVLINNLPLSQFQLEFLIANRAQNIIWYNYDSLWYVSLVPFLLFNLFHCRSSYRQLINGIKKAKSVEYHSSRDWGQLRN